MGSAREKMRATIGLTTNSSPSRSTTIKPMLRSRSRKSARSRPSFDLSHTNVSGVMDSSHKKMSSAARAPPKLCCCCWCCSCCCCCAIKCRFCCCCRMCWWPEPPGATCGGAWAAVAVAVAVAVAAPAVGEDGAVMAPLLCLAWVRSAGESRLHTRAMTSSREVRNATSRQICSPTPLSTKSNARLVTVCPGGRAGTE